MAVAESRAEVVWTGNLFEGDGRFEISSGALPETGVSWQARTDRPSGTTSPEELIAAAHASCFAMALSNVLDEAGHPPEELRINAVCRFDDEAVKITGVDLQVAGSVPGIEPDEFQRLAREGEQGCPVSNALRGNVEINLSATLA